ncbi:MAG: porin [Hyphomicrobiales bacterium]|nr:porin [Hyphomicrobiales bacterium]
MKFKAWALGSAALLAAVGTASASDLLPTKKAAPAQYVKICSIDGMTGFTLPGSDTCLKIAGMVRFEAGYLGSGDEWAQAGTFAAPVYKLAPASTRNSVKWFTRARFKFDARSATPYGTLRSFFSLQLQHTSDINTNGGNGETATIDKAFIQWAGLTVGRAQSFYDFYAGNYQDLQGQSDITVSTLAYTASFGGGFSATLALENNRDRLVNGFAWNNNGAALDGLTARTNQIPDVVAVLRVDQSWGSAQLSAALHQVNLVDAANAANVSKTGFAVQGGLKFLLPSMGAGDALWFEASYSQAALSYSGMVGGAKADFFYNNGFDNTNGDVIIDGTAPAGALFNVRVPTSFGVMAAMEHHFSPQFWIAPMLGYQTTSYSNNTATSLASNWSVLTAAMDIHWDPVTNLDTYLDLYYTNTHNTLPSNATIAFNPATGVFKTNTGSFGGFIHIERDF